jgi:hypothetical protein
MKQIQFENIKYHKKLTIMNNNNNFCRNRGFKKRYIIAGWVLVISSFLSLPTLATTSQSESYQAAFFAQFVPHNALEMVQQLPGFTFDGGASKRGFGGNAGNVLIDGVRPTTKSGGIAAALIRIPANQVSSIELLRGNIGEAEGHVLIANVISIKSQTSGSWALRARQTQNTAVKPNVEAVLRTPLGEWETAFDLDIGITPRYRGATVDQYDSQDELLATAIEDYTYSNRIDYLNGEGSKDIAGGKLTLNGRLAWDKYKGKIGQLGFSNPAVDNGVADSLWTLDEVNRSKLSELGVDWVKTSNDWKLRLLSLGVVRDSHYQYDYHQQSSNGQPFDSRYERDRLKTEYVTRATYSSVADVTVKPEFGIEVTNNRLDTDAQVGQLGGLIPVFGSNVVVQEWRGEAFANVVYQPSQSLVIEGGLSAEVSQIKVKGDANTDQSFKFFKPRLTVNYQLNDKTRLTFEAERRVGQLSFNHFAANSVAYERRTNAGNPELAPSQTDEVSSTFDWRFSERGSIKVKAFHQWRNDTLEQIILSTDEQGGIEQGLGNAGDATVWGISSTLKLPLDGFIANGLLDLTYRKSNSDFDDPIINGSRRINNNNAEWIKVQFRQDLTAQQFAWGFDLLGSFNYDGFLVDEIQSTNAEKALHFFVETSRFFGVKIQLKVNNLNTQRLPFTRRFYQDTRAGEYLGKDVAKRKHQPYYLLSVFGEF